MRARYSRILLLDASSDTEKNNDPTNDRLTIASPKSSMACFTVRRRAKRGPTTNSQARRTIERRRAVRRCRAAIAHYRPVGIRQG